MGSRHGARRPAGPLQALGTKAAHAASSYPQILLGLSGGTELADDWSRQDGRHPIARSSSNNPPSRATPQDPAGPSHRRLKAGSVLALAWLLAGCAAAPAVQLPPTPPAHPDSINGQLSRSWHHVGDPVSAQRQAEDFAKCKVIAAQTPAMSEIRYYVTYINCLRAAGYEPDRQ